MTGWDREYLEHKAEYLELFDKSMQKEQEANVEFLEDKLKLHTGRKYVVACSNGTDALHFALRSLGIRKGDEVLVPQFSWISSASCVSMVGATPVFCEIDLSSYHMTLESIKKMYSPKVKAIVYPHLFGNMSETKEIIDFCKEKNIAFVEDAAQSLGASLNEVKAGSIGDISTFSFNSNKVISGISGGGAVLTNDKDKADLIRKLRKHGNNEILGYNSKMLLFNARVIDFRLRKLKEWISKRQDIAKQYESNSLNHNYHKYVIRFQNKRIRDKIKEKLNAKIHYDKPLSENVMYKNIDYRKEQTYNSKIVCDTILSLPLDPYMKQEEIEKVINIIIISLEQEKNMFENNIKKLIGDDIFDISLINKTTEPIYDYIVEKIYTLPEYVQSVEFKSKEKLKIAFNKFYENLTRNTK